MRRSSSLSLMARLTILRRDRSRTISATPGLSHKGISCFGLRMIKYSAIWMALHGLSKKRPAHVFASHPLPDPPPQGGRERQSNHFARWQTQSRANTTREALMKFTLAWLKEHLDTDEPLDMLVDKLTMIGLEVESVSDQAKVLGAFTIARVISAEQHAN